VGKCGGRVAASRVRLYAPGGPNEKTKKIEEKRRPLYCLQAKSSGTIGTGPERSAESITLRKKRRSHPGLHPGDGKGTAHEKAPVGKGRPRRPWESQNRESPRKKLEGGTSLLEAKSTKKLRLLGGGVRTGLNRSEIGKGVPTRKRQGTRRGQHNPLIAWGKN